MTYSTADAAVPEENATSSKGSSSSSTNNFHVTVCLIGYSLSFIIFGSQVSILGPTIGPLSERLGVDEPQLSPLFTALGISCIISGAPSGWLVDLVPTHYVLIGSLLTQSVGFALVPLMPSVWTLTTLWFIICFSYNFTNSAVFSSLTWMFPGRAGGALNLVLAMFGIGSFLIPLAAMQCHLHLGNDLAVFWIVSAVSALSTIPFFFAESPKPPCKVEHGEGDVMLKKEEGHKTMAMVVTVSCILLVFFSTTAETAVGNWINTYSQDIVGLDRQHAAWINSTFWGCFTLGRIVGALLSSYTTPAGLLLSFTPLSVIGCAIPFLSQLWDRPMDQTSVLAMAVLSGMGNSAGYANAVALMEHYVPVTGAINGLFGAVAGGACMVGPNLVALLSSVYSTKDAGGETHYWFQAMAWVGMLFYTLHFPALAAALIAGSQLKTTSSESGSDDGVKEPLLEREGQDVEQAGSCIGGGMANENLLSLSPRASSPNTLGRSYRRMSTDDSAIGRISFPGHLPVSASLSRSNTLVASSRRSSPGPTYRSSIGHVTLPSEGSPP